MWSTCTLIPRSSDTRRMHESFGGFVPARAWLQMLARSPSLLDDSMGKAHLCQVCENPFLRQFDPTQAPSCFGASVHVVVGRCPMYSQAMQDKLHAFLETSKSGSLSLGP